MNGALRSVGDGGGIVLRGWLRGGVRWARRVAKQLLDELEDEDRPEWKYAHLHEAVESATARLEPSARREVIRARELLAQLETDDMQMGAGMRDLTAVTAVARTFEKHGEAERIRYVIERLQAYGAPVPDAACECYVRSFFVRENPDDAERALQELMGKGYRPSTTMAAELIRRFAEFGRKDVVKNILKWVNNDDPLILGATASVDASNGSQAKAINTLHSLPDLDPALLQDLMRTLPYEEAMREFKKVLQRGCKPPISTFCLLASRNLKDAEEILGSAIDAGLKPIEDCYILLAKASLLLEDSCRFKEIQREALIALPGVNRPDLFRMAMELYLHEGHLEKGQQVLHELVIRGIELDENTFLVAQKLLRRSRTPAETNKPVGQSSVHHLVSAALRQLNEDGEDALLVALQKLASAKATDRIERVFEQAEERGWNVRPVHIMTVLEEMVRNQEHPQAADTFVRHARNKTAYVAKHFAAAITLCAPRPDVCEPLLQIARRRGFDNDTSIIKAKFRVICAGFDLGQATKMIAANKEVIDQEEEFALYINILEPRGQAAAIDRRILEGKEVSSVSYDVLLSKLIDDGSYDSVEKIILRMRREKVRPSTRTFELWTKTASKLGSPQMAMRAYRVLLVNRFSWSEQIFKNLVTAYCEAGEFRGAQTIVRQVKLRHKLYGSNLKLLLHQKLQERGEYTILIKELLTARQSKQQVQERLMFLKEDSQSVRSA